MDHLHRKTPIMGWASWNCFRTNISEERLKTQIDALLSTGLADCGYTYFNMDDGFFGGRDENGRLQTHPERFPNGIGCIAAYAHSKGLMAGAYSEAGDNTCGHYYDQEGENGQGVGLYGYEEQDLSMYLEEMGFDFIKVDWCGGLRMGLDAETQYTKIGKIVEEIRQRTGRCIVYNVCRWAFPGPWVTAVADSWRTGSDITPNFHSVLQQIDNIRPLAKYCGPGHVNDLDMMQLGNGMNEEEEKTHFAMWCMMSTPLIIGCDLTQIPESTLRILKNRELIALDQDSACLQATVRQSVRDEEDTLLGEVWVKDLGQKDSTCKAVAFLNRSEAPLHFAVELAQVSLSGTCLHLRDLCSHEDVEPTQKICCTVPPHGVAVYRVEATAAIPYTESVQEEEDFEFLLPDGDANVMVENGGIFVDVRSPEEFCSGHFEKAINIPHTEILEKAPTLLPDKGRNIVLWCPSGKRSSQAMKTLRYLGYTCVYRRI